MEQWKDVPGYEGRYQVSNHGRVKSNHGKGRILKVVSNKGIPIVGLHKNADQTTRKVIQLVTDAFLGEKPDAHYHVHHIDGDPSNNAASNLKWKSSKGENGPLEQWKDIEGYEGLYQISSLGNVKTLFYKGNILKPRRITGQSFIVMLYKNGDIITHQVARLVAHAFLGGKRDSKWKTTHIDGDISNNTASNLKWIIQRGEDSSYYKLTESEVLEIRRLAGSMSQEALGEIFDITQAHVGNIIRREIWTHI